MGYRKRRRRDNDFSFIPKQKSFNGKKLMNGIAQWLVLGLVAVILGYSIVTFCVQTVTVVGPSMSDTLKDGQIVVVNKLIYKFEDIKRYDIVAFQRVGKNEYYEIKRVVGLPGEKIKISNGAIFINGEPLADAPFNEDIIMSGVAGEEILIGDNEYFILGDNFNNSEDSRYTNVGNISKTEIIGKVVYIIKPENERGKIDNK